MDGPAETVVVVVVVVVVVRQVFEPTSTLLCLFSVQPFQRNKSACSLDITITERTLLVSLFASKRCASTSLLRVSLDGADPCASRMFVCRSVDRKF